MSPTWTTVGKYILSLFVKKKESYGKKVSRWASLVTKKGDKDGQTNQKEIKKNLKRKKKYVYICKGTFRA
jgi:hypothetical protein